MNRDELLTLPATIPVETAFRAVGVGRTLGYDLIRRNKFPVQVLHLGRRMRVVTADLLALLGVTPEQADGLPLRQEVQAAKIRTLTRRPNYDPDYRPAA